MYSLTDVETLHNEVEELKAQNAKLLEAFGTFIGKFEELAEKVYTATNVSANSIKESTDNLIGCILNNQ